MQPYQDIDPQQLVIETLIDQYEQAQSNREGWESHWQECYDYALPQRQPSFDGLSINGQKKMAALYDATALDAVDQLAASMLGNLTPPWSQWFGFKPGPDVKGSEKETLSSILEESARTLQAHFDNSNFHVEIHQCFLDLAVGGTASLAFEETGLGNLSAFKFSAIPLIDITLEEGDNGFLDRTFRPLSLTPSQIANRYGDITDIMYDKGTDHAYKILEIITPKDGLYHFHAIFMDGASPTLIKTGTFDQSPIISFRWMKSPGESYGRSPVMKALPDIKTANKVVELILKNASIAVTGIWQADDDGVLNPANIELVPGAIIPKAVGSQGLKPLDMPGRFDVSELVLNDLRARIRHALLVDKLGALNGPRMTATEVMERSSDMAVLMGATYGRLQTELLTPLIQRAYGILQRRGEIADIDLDGRFVTMDYRSPLAKAQGQRNAQEILSWLQALSSMGAAASSVINIEKVGKHLSDALGIPADFINTQQTTLQPPLTQPTQPKE